MKSKSIKQLAFIGLLIALHVILSRITSISFGVVKITFGFIATAISGFLFGPVIGAFTAGASDLVGFFLFPDGVFFPGYTLTATISGTIYGLMLYSKKPTFNRVLLAVVIQSLVCSVFLNTLWTAILFNKAFLGLLPVRLFKNLLSVPINATMLFITLKYIPHYFKILNTEHN